MNMSIDKLWKSVPYFHLSEENKKFIGNILIQNNKLLKEWQSYVPRNKIRFFRNNILNGNFNKVIEFIPESLRTTFIDDCLKIQKIRKEKIESLDGKTIEETVIAGYSRLVLKRIYNFKSKSSFNSDILFDMYQESYIKILDAMYSYSDENICFSTFLCAAVQNHLYQMLEESNLVRIPYSDRKLIKEFKKKQKQKFITTNEVLNIEQYLEDSELGQKDSSKLKKAFLKMRVNGIDEGKNMDIPDKSSCEFIASSSLEIDCTNVESNIRDSILKANLTHKEKEVLEYALVVEMKHGWQTELAKHMNVTKMRVSQLVKSAFGKIKTHILAK